MNYSAYALISLFSLLVGSFLNVVISRLPLMLEKRWRDDYMAYFDGAAPHHTTPFMNLFLPRSFCFQCNVMIPIWRNIPILSYILSKGRCFSCTAHIKRRYLVVECLTPILSFIASIYFGLHLALIYILLFIWMSICIFFIDIECGLIPDELSLGLLWVGLLANALELLTSLPDAVYASILGYIGLRSFIELYQWITKKHAMGHGDFKLYAALGAWFGCISLPIILLVSASLGTILGVSYFIIKKKSFQTPIPFGPFLVIAGLIGLFYHQQWILFKI